MNEHEEQWLTGFTEGDGSVGLYRVLRVSYAQKERDVLDYIVNLLGKGKIHENANNQGTIYKLVYNGHTNCAPLIEVFLKHVVGLHTCGRLNAVLECPLATSHRPTIDWLTGFFDAEGTSSNMPNLFIAQKERAVLNSIQETFGGNIRESYESDHQWYVWGLSGNGARELAPELIARSQCSTKKERLFTNFNGPTHYTLHREEKRVYNKNYWENHKRVQAYIKEHPEIVGSLEVK